MVLMILFAGQQRRYRHNRCVVTVQEGEGGMTRESSIETYTLPYMK